MDWFMSTAGSHEKQRMYQWSCWGQCQEGAVELGKMIERTREGLCCYPLVEIYCEQVYQIYEKQEQGKEINGKEAYKTLRKSLIQIENSVKTVMPMWCRCSIMTVTETGQGH